MRRLRINGSEATVLPVVKGLVSEADRVTEAFHRLRPDAVALSISREELSGLRSPESCGEYELSDLEQVYAAYLEAFGEVRLPPPCFAKAVELCDANGVPLIPLDMNDEVYTEAYCTNVTTMDMIRESFFARRAGRRGYDLTSPEAFALDWDSRVNRAKGFRELERARERHMAAALTNMARKYRNILAVIEVERAEGVGREASLLSSVEHGTVQTAESQPS